MSSNNKSEMLLNNDSFDDETNQSACQLINENLVKQHQSNTMMKSNDIVPSISSISKDKFNSRVSTIGYQTFKNENSPFNSPLKRSNTLHTFVGVFNSIFKQNDYNHFIEPKSFLEDKPFNKLGYSRSVYDNERIFLASEPTPENELNQNNRLIKTISSASLLPNLIDIQSIRQSLMSLAVALTKHSNSNTGRILGSDEPAKDNSQKNSLTDSSSMISSTSTPTSLHTNNETSTIVAMQDDLTSFNLNLCTLCLCEYIEPNEFVILDKCMCKFCRPCLEQYCTILIRDHSLTSSQITCPSSDCSNSNSYISSEQIKQLVDNATFRIYEKIKLDLEVHLDYPNRVWCPRPNCETVCIVSKTESNRIENNFDTTNLMVTNSVQTSNNQKIDRRVPVNCKNCNLTFCLHCRSAYHGKMPCQSLSEDESLSLLLSRTRTPNSLNEYIKKCPRCGIWIERERGCAQMMCMKCKHVFCWFCLSSLEEDFLLRHYDSGSCKNKLGHSKGTLIWLRLQVIAVFFGFAIFLLLVSPLIFLLAPVLLIAHCFCNFSIRTKVWNKDDDSSVNQSQLNLSSSIRKTKQINDKNQSISTEPITDQLINLSESNQSINQTNDELTNKNQQLIQAYIQNNGVHTSVVSDHQTLDIDGQKETGLFEEHPIKLSGYDEIENNETKKEPFKFLSWFKLRKSKPIDPPPRLSSMLDVDKHRKFIEELMTDKLNIDNELNNDIEDHYMIIKPSEIVDLESNRIKSVSKWLFWRRDKS